MIILIFWPKCRILLHKKFSSAYSIVPALTQVFVLDSLARSFYPKLLSVITYHTQSLAGAQLSCEGRDRRMRYILEKSFVLGTPIGLAD